MAESQCYFPSTRQLFLLLVTSVALGGFAAFSGGQSSDNGSRKIPLAVADIERIFKEARAFNEEMEKLKKEIEALDKDVRDRLKQVEGSVSSTSDSSGSAAAAAQAKQQEAKMLAEAAVLVKKQEFMEKEAQLYGDTYKRIEGISAQIAKTRDIGLVLRLVSKPYESNDRSAVLQAVNRPIVFTSVPDLTNEIIAELNR